MTLVTAVIPTHNHEAWVQDSILSIINQTYKNLRLIVVDDGSTDKSFNKALELLETPNQVKVEQPEPQQVWTGNIKGIPTILSSFKEARGPSFARNYGIKCGCEGTDLFALLDSDDLYHPEKIEKSVKIYEEHPKFIGIIYSDYHTFNEAGRYRQFKEPYSRERLMSECIINCDSVFAKWVFEKVGFFDEDLRTCEDYDMYMRASEVCIPVHIPESLIDIRVGTHSSSSNVSKENWQKNYKRVFEKLKERQNEHTI